MEKKKISTKWNKIWILHVNLHFICVIWEGLRRRILPEKSDLASFWQFKLCCSIHPSNPQSADVMSHGPLYSIDGYRSVLQLSLTFLLHPCFFFLAWWLDVTKLTSDMIIIYCDEYLYGTRHQLAGNPYCLLLILWGCVFFPLGYVSQQIRKIKDFQTSLSLLTFQHGDIGLKCLSLSWPLSLWPYRCTLSFSPSQGHNLSF